MYNKNDKQVLNEMFLSKNKDAFDILNHMEHQEQKLNKDIWDFSIKETIALIDSSEDRFKVIDILGKYIDFAISQGYTTTPINKVKMLE